MDNQPATPIVIQTNPLPSGRNWLPTGGIPKSFPKIVFIVLSLVIVAELIWGAWYILRPLPGQNIATLTKNPAALFTPAKPTAQINLESSKKDLKVGDSLIVDILVNTGGSATEGTDISIKYDPKRLSLSGTPDVIFTKGSLFPEYLGQSVDNKLGIFKISGISNLTSKNTSPGQGKFGSLNFKSIAAGKTTISVDFLPAKTTDSNVIDAKLSQDILDKVTNLEVMINQ